MAKLTEKQKKKIVVEYIAGLSGEDDKKRVTHEELARKYGVSETTIRNIIKSDPEFAEKCGHIKKTQKKPQRLNGKSSSISFNRKCSP